MAGSRRGGDSGGRSDDRAVSNSHDGTTATVHRLATRTGAGLPLQGRNLAGRRLGGVDHSHLAQGDVPTVVEGAAAEKHGPEKARGLANRELG